MYTLQAGKQHGVAYIADEVSTLQAAGGERGYRIDAEAAAGGHLVAYAADVVSTLTAPGERWRIGADEAAGGQLIAFSHTAGIDLQPSASVAPTLNAGHDTMPSITNGTIVRRLTPLECERLQGFPDNWTQGQADSHRSKQLGNSVAVPVFEWVGRRLVAVDNQLTTDLRGAAV